MTPSQRSPSSRARADDALQPGERLLDRAVHVLLVVGLRGGEEQVDLVEVLAQRERVLEPALVGDQHRHGHVVRDLSPSQHLGAVGELRDHVGAHEARDLEPPQTRVGEHLDEPDLVVRRDDLGLVLEAVPRADLADPDVFGHASDSGKAAAHPERLTRHVRRVV